MSRSLATVMRTQGPFQGVDLSRDSRDLGPMYAQMAHNVHCAHGAIERRPGISLVADDQLPAEPEVIYHHSSATGDAAKEWFAAAVFVGGFWKIYTLRADDTVWNNRYTGTVDMTAQRDLRPNFYRVSKDFVLVTVPGEQCFGMSEYGDIIPGGAFFGGSFDDLGIAFLSSLAAHSESSGSRLIIPKTQDNTVFVDPIHVYYWFTFARFAGLAGQLWPFVWETNAIGPAVEVLGGLASGRRSWLRFETADIMAIKPDGATHMRVYRQFYVPSNDGTGDGALEPYSPTRRQVYLMPLDSLQTDPEGWAYDPEAEISYGYYDIPLTILDGSRVLWDGCGDEWILNESVAPTRNAPPPPGTMLTAIHQNKMFYARVPFISSVPGTLAKGEDSLWYSAEGEYFHVAEENIMKVGEDGRPITGLMTYFGQLLIFKEDEVWALRGSLDVATNASDALGSEPPWGTHELSLVARGVGCIAVKGGPAVLEAGNLLYFVGQGGLYVYNGQVIIEVSQAIAPALRGISVETMAGSQLAHDPINKLIYWFIGAMGTPDPGQGPVPLLVQYPDWEPQVWVYHYADATDQGGGRWTHWGQFGSDVTCIASRQTSILAQPPGPQLVLGLANWRVAQTSDGHVDAFYPATTQGIPWRWHGGDLHIGAPERQTRWHYLTVQFERQSHDAAKVTAYLDGNVEQLMYSVTFDLDNPASQLKWRLGLRSNTLAPRFSGLSEQAPVRITGFQIDALPIGSR